MGWASCRIKEGKSLGNKVLDKHEGVVGEGSSGQRDGSA